MNSLPMAESIGPFDFLPYGTIDRAMEWLAVGHMLDKVEQRSAEEGLAERLQVQRASLQSHMDMIYRDKTLIGVVVSTPRAGYLFVDAAYVRPGAMDDEAQAALDQHIMRRASQYDLHRLRMYTTRKAEAMLKPHGWRMTGAHYEKRVDQ